MARRKEWSSLLLGTAKEAVGTGIKLLQQSEYLCLKIESPTLPQAFMIHLMGHPLHADVAATTGLAFRESYYGRELLLYILMLGGAVRRLSEDQVPLIYTWPWTTGHILSV